MSKLETGVDTLKVFELMKKYLDDNATDKEIDLLTALVPFAIDRMKIK